MGSNDFSGGQMKRLLCGWHFTCGVLHFSAIQETTAEVGVMLSVITRNRFWTHALSTLSLLQSLQYAKLHAQQAWFAWHILDDASEKSDARKKNDMITDLTQRGWVDNYTRLDRRSGTVHALRHAVDTFLMRKEFHLFLHCDDDILMGEGTLTQAVHDYLTDHSKPSRAGGVLALFVNSWLDEQLSDVSSSPYATAPFLGGAAYIADRLTLEATGNPWAHALKNNPRVSPHEAHVQWLRQLLPSKGLQIWIRWQKPYECQHLGNVRTLNFGMQPEWEPMWAIDHTSKKIVEVPGYSSADVRTALWAQQKCLRNFVLYQNSIAREPLKLPTTGTIEHWSSWTCSTHHFHYLEIGTSDFDTLLSRHVWRPDVRGISIEPLRTYFDKLPSGTNKLLLNIAISDHDGYETLYFVRPDVIDAHLGSESLCQRSHLHDVGLTECLPGWMRGASSIKKVPEGVRQFLGDDMLRSVLAKVQVPCMTYETLVTVYGVGFLIAFQNTKLHSGSLAKSTL